MKMAKNGAWKQGEDCWAGSAEIPWGGLIAASLLRQCPPFSSSQVGVRVEIDLDQESNPGPYSYLLMEPHRTQFTPSSRGPGH